MLRRQRHASQDFNRLVQDCSKPVRVRSFFCWSKSELPLCVHDELSTLTKMSSLDNGDAAPSHTHPPPPPNVLAPEILSTQHSRPLKNGDHH